MSGTSANHRRRRAHELRSEGLALREIGQRLGVGKTTVSRWLAQPCSALHPVPNIQTPDGQPVAGAQAGNERSLKHGATSEQRIAPLREKHSDALRRDFDWLDDRRLALLADRLARIESGSAWLAGQGGVVRGDAGEVFPVVDRIEKWSSTAERVLAELWSEDRHRGSASPDVTAYLAALPAEEPASEEKP